MSLLGNLVKLTGRLCLSNSFNQTQLAGAMVNVLQVREMSRVKRRTTHPPHWHTMKNRQRTDENLTEENKGFLQEVVHERFQGAGTSPLKGDVGLVKTEWNPRTIRTGVIAKNVGVYPLWEKDGTRVLCTLLQVLDNHVVRYIEPEVYGQTELGQRKFKDYRLKNKLGCLVVGAEACDPQKFTKEYSQLFSSAGLMPKKRLTRFFVSPSAAMAPGTPLFASHFRAGQFVDVYGKTTDHGFQGVVKRWGMKGGPASHGCTKAHRRVGSIGSGREKARVWPGTKMPGHMGTERRTCRGLQILRINHKYNVIYVRGTVPGPTNSIVRIHDTVLPLRKPKEALPTPTLLPTELKNPEEDAYHSTMHSFEAPSIAA